jgi:gas vesicle protein
MKFSFLKGVLWGVLAGILLAPRAGRETREELKKIYGEITDRITEELSRLKEVTAEAYGQVTQSVVNAYVEAKKITTHEAAQIRFAHQEGMKREDRVS